MENMKRFLSGFLALVLILGMLPCVPMVAGAEEVEAQPETLAVETTAAAVPEETEAPETTVQTEPEVTEPAATEAEETVPAETEAQETVPTETLPEETVAEETVAEETVPEVSEEPADANDEIIYAKTLKVTASKNRTYVGDDVKLTVTFAPSNTTETEVEWDVTTNEADIDMEILAKHGYLRAANAGIVTLAAVQTVASGDEIRSEEITVEFVNYTMEINRGAIPKENIPEEPIYGAGYILQTGNTVDLSVRYLTWLDGETPKAELPLHTANVKWSMAVVVPAEEGGEARGATYVTTGEDVTKYISWTETADTKQITMKAKLVTEYKYIMVTAEERIGNKDVIFSSVVFRLYPDSYKLFITDEDGNDVTNGTILLDMADPDVKITQTLTAKVWPEEGDENLVWSVNNAMVALTDPDEEDDANKEMIITADPRSGETVITIQGAEHPGVYATVTVKRVRLIQAIEPSKATAELQTKELGVGKSATLEAVAYGDREIVDNALLKWELAEGDEAYATITDKGVLTAKNVAEGKVITVICSVIDNEDEAFFELYIPIRPKATAVKILSDTFLGEDYSPRALTGGEVINDKTIVVDAEQYVAAVPAFIVEHYADDYTGAGDPVGAKQEVSWKSSNTAVAAFDPLTDKLVWKGKTGTTKITATAKDGSGKSASVTLEFGIKLAALEIEANEGMFLRSGSSWTFDLSYYPQKATNKAVNWYVYHLNADGDLVDASAIATITASGKLTAKTVYDNHQVVVFAVSKDDDRIFDAFEVTIRPKTDYSLTILDDSGNCVTKSTISMNVGDSISLDAVFVGEEVGEYYFADPSWKSSSSSVVWVEDGYLEALKTGTATITATAHDGKKATVTVKVVSQVDYIEIYQKNDLYILSGGKSLDLKADVYDFDTATDKNPKGKPTITKVTWHIEEGGEQYATVNASGKVTAVKGYDGEMVTIGVYAKATDGSRIVSDTYYIDIYPAVESMRIDFSESAQTTGSYTHYLSYEGESVGTMTAVVFPTNACPEVTWKSSNVKIAEVDEYGNITAYAPGTVTFTATAVDGTNKKATFKLTIVSKIAWVEWNNDANELVPDESFAIAGGKSLTLKPVFYGPDGKKLNVAVEWEIEKIYDDYGTAFVKKFSKGTLTTEKVTQPKYTNVRIWVDERYAAWDGFEIGEFNGKTMAYAEVYVGVFPATTSMKILENGVAKTTVWAKAAADTEIQLQVVPNEFAAYGWTWTSSNKNIASVDETGLVTCVQQKDGSYKAGTVTITATAKDGTGKKATIKIIFAK